MPNSSLHIALIHYPVVNKIGETIGSAVTNLDIHDIARTAKTYGVGRYHIVTPYQDQQKLVQELLDHWLVGAGATANPARKEALEIVSLASSLGDILVDLRKEYGKTPLLVATSAKKQPKLLSFGDLTGIIQEGRPVLLLFGTAHGLAPEVLEQVDTSLPPLSGGCGYNHLSVRSAAAIIIDRLLGVEIDRD